VPPDNVLERQDFAAFDFSPFFADRFLAINRESAVIDGCPVYSRACARTEDRRSVALKWSEVDFDNRTLRVAGSLQRWDHKLVIVPPKTKKSARMLNVPKVLLDKLRDHRTQQLKERLAAGTNWQDHNLVFCSSVATPVEPRNVRRKLDAIMDKKMRYFRLHDLRHFFTSLLLAQGVELKIVSELLGHSSIQITSDIYAHILPKVKEQTMDVMNAILTVSK
jgi:integrase